MSKFNHSVKYFFLYFIFTFFLIGNVYSEYPNTSIGVIDLNLILSEADAAKKAAKEIEQIAINIENEIAESDKEMIDNQNEILESQSIMAPDAFEVKRSEYEKKVQNYNIIRQEKLMSIDKLVSESRNDVLNALKPILEEIANNKGITILLEKNSVLLNADSMDITNEAIIMLNKKLPNIQVIKE